MNQLECRSKLAGRKAEKKCINRSDELTSIKPVSLCAPAPRSSSDPAAVAVANMKHNKSENNKCDSRLLIGKLGARPERMPPF